MTGFAGAYSPYFYHGPVQRLVVLCKFGGVDAAAEPLARAMADCVRGQTFDALVPVPLHPRRLRERGVNQAELLCRLVGKANGVPILPALTRARNTKRQSGLRPADREGNVRDAFIAAKSVKGLRLLLVDDVRTSGSTARACAKALNEAGAAEVSLLTAAVAHQKRSAKTYFAPNGPPASPFSGQEA